MNQNIADLWARTSLLLWPDDLVVASFPVSVLPDLARVAAPHLRGFSALVVERDEVSLTIPETAWPAITELVPAALVAGPFRAITLDLALDFGVCGYLLPAVERLAAAEISIVPQCAFQKDHLLVGATQAADAMEVLLALIADARQMSSSHG